MAAIAPQLTSLAGLAPTYTACAAGGDTIQAPLDERTILHFKNAGASPQTVTVNAVSPTAARVAGVGNLPVPAIAVAIPAGGERMIGPIPAAYIDAIGNINLTYSGVTSLTVAGVRLPNISN